MQPSLLMRFILCAGLILGAVGGRPLSFVFASEDQEILAKSLAHYTKGIMDDLLEENEAGIEEYKQAIHFDPKSYAAHLRLGIDYARLGNLAPSVDELTVASKLNPDDLKVHYFLALVYSTQNEFDKAAGEYELILKHFSQADPENIEIYSYLGQLYYSQRKYQKAVEQFEKILALDPQNSAVMYLLGSLYLELDKRPKAMELFKQSIAADSTNDGSLNSLSYIYAEDGIHLEEALDLVKRALEIKPDSGAYLDSLGWVYYKKEMYPQALESLQKANALLEDPVIYDHLGDVYLKLNEIENAKKYWNLSLKLLPAQTNVLKKLDALGNSASRKETLSSQTSR